MPGRPAARACQNSPQLWPSAEITPAPVTTTRCCMSGLCGRLAPLATFDQFRDSIHNIAHGSDTLRCVVRNIYVELVFHREKNVDPVQRINAQLFESAVGRNLLLGKMLGGGNDSSDALGQFRVGHRMSVTFSK